MRYALLLVVVCAAGLSAQWRVAPTAPPEPASLAHGVVVAVDPYRTGGPRYTVRVPAFVDGARVPLLDVGRPVDLHLSSSGARATVAGRTVKAWAARAGQAEGDTRYYLDTPPGVPSLFDVRLAQAGLLTWWSVGAPVPCPTP